MVVFVIGFASETNAQGKGHHDGKDRRDDRYGRHGGDQHGKGDWQHDQHEHRYDKREHKHKHCRSHTHAVHHHAPVVIKHYHERPRYMYYRDYDVYYDSHRDVYITWSGRNWIVSASLPVVLRRVDRRRAVRMEVDYVRDDFPSYLQTHKPSYRRIYTEF